MGAKKDALWRQVAEELLKAKQEEEIRDYELRSIYDWRATHVNWTRLDGTVVHHRYDAILDMIRRGYTDRQIGQHFSGVNEESMRAYRKLIAGTLSKGYFRLSRIIYDTKGNE